MPSTKQDFTEANKLQIETGADWAVGLVVREDSQVLTMVGTPGAGFFRASYIGTAGGLVSNAPTPNIAYNAAAAAVQLAFEKLANVGPGNVIASGIAGGPWTVVFDDLVVAEAGNPLILIDNSGLDAFSGAVVVERHKKDLTGYTATMQIRQAELDDSVLLELTTDNDFIIIGESEGEIVLNLPGSVTRGLSWAGTAVYDLKLLSPAGVTEYLINGNVQLRHGITV